MLTPLKMVRVSLTSMPSALPSTGVAIAPMAAKRKIAAVANCMVKDVWIDIAKRWEWISRGDGSKCV